MKRQLSVLLLALLIGGTTAATAAADTKRVALTFDDGPSQYTNNLLRVLRHHRARATFYVVGQYVGASPAVLRHAVRDGHEIGNHSWNHADLTALSERDVRRQLGRTNRAVKDAIGEPPRVFRPPYGATNGSVRRIGRSRGLWSALWDVDTRDYELPGCGEIVRRVLGAIDPGDTVLMHDGGGDRSQTVCATKRIVRELGRRNYRMVTQSRLRREGDRPPSHFRSASALLDP